jgi:hypothetical protein
MDHDITIRILRFLEKVALMPWEVDLLEERSCAPTTLNPPWVRKSYVRALKATKSRDSTSLTLLSTSGGIDRRARYRLHIDEQLGLEQGPPTMTENVAAGRGSETTNTN